MSKEINFDIIEKENKKMNFLKQHKDSISLFLNIFNLILIIIGFVYTIEINIQNNNNNNNEISALQDVLLTQNNSINLISNDLNTQKQNFNNLFTQQNNSLESLNNLINQQNTNSQILNSTINLLNDSFTTLTSKIVYQLSKGQNCGSENWLTCDPNCLTNLNPNGWYTFASFTINRYLNYFIQICVSNYVSNYANHYLSEISICKNDNVCTDTLLYKDNEFYNTPGVYYLSVCGFATPTLNENDIIYFRMWIPNCNNTGDYDIIIFNLN